MNIRVRLGLHKKRRRWFTQKKLNYTLKKREREEREGGGFMSLNVLDPDTKISIEGTKEEIGEAKRDISQHVPLPWDSSQEWRENPTPSQRQCSPVLHQPKKISRC